MEEALIANNIAYNREARIKIYSNDTGKVVGTYVPDFLMDDKIIVELKSSRYTTKTDEKQLYHYLRNSPYEVGYLVNFSTPQIYIKRIIYTNDRKLFLERRR
ncbi:MAG TPA: GxxExxY protein [Proteobacteria bacterium]|nr:GxxExxY protein [Pseudomonadota bacterium]